MVTDSACSASAWAGSGRKGLPLRQVSTLPQPESGHNFSFLLRRAGQKVEWAALPPFTGLSSHSISFKPPAGNTLRGKMHICYRLASKMAITSSSVKGT